MTLKPGPICFLYSAATPIPGLTTSWHGRANGVATYRNSDFFGLVEGLNFALQYQGNNEGSNAVEDQEGTKNGHEDVRYPER